MGLFDTRGNIAEWTDSQAGYYDQISVRGGSWQDDRKIIDSYSYDAAEQRQDLGFRVIRNIALEDRRFPGIVFSNSLNVRNEPGLSGNVIGTRNSLTPIAVYAIAGTGKWEKGILDLWLKISEEEWVNAYYVTMIPFFTRATGRINKLSELVFDITDTADIREPNFQYYEIAPENQELLLHTASTHWDVGVIKALLQAGADPEYRNMSDLRPIDLIHEGHWGDNAGTEDETRQLFLETVED